MEVRTTKPVDTEALKSYALELGFQSAGVCEASPAPHFDAYRAWLDKGYHGTMTYLERHLALKSEPQSLLPGANSVVAVALNYNQPNPRQAGKPRFARYALGRDYHKVLRGKLRKLAAWLEREAPGSKSRACVDSAPILEREYAHLAGLGWFGKNTMLIDSKRGSWFFIGLLLTTAQLEPDRPSVGGCGSCMKCVEACPTGAILQEDGRWQVDARRCISYLTIEHRGPVALDTHGWTFGCDVCQEVCPFNDARPSQPQRAAVTSEPDLLRHRSWPSLDRVAVLEEGDWDELTAGSAIRRAGIEGLRRNAALNLRQSR